MGADFLFAIAEVHVDRDVALGRIPEVGDLYLDEIAEFTWGEDQPDDELRQQVRDFLGEAVDVVYDGLEGFRRDCGSQGLEGDGVQVVTGGMSWGDPPTEAFPYVWAFYLADLGRRG